MTNIAILIPVLNRPHRVKPLVESIYAASKVTDCTAVFLVSPEDDEEKAAIKEAHAYGIEVGWPPGPGDYARKINLGATWAQSDHDFVLLGADDLEFHPGWAERALACHLETHACVIGTNDLGNDRVLQGHHSTHPLVSVEYLECGTWDEPDSGKLLHEGYQHNFVDNEFVETAQVRETWAMALDCHVEHHHPFWHKAQDDATYRLGKSGFHADRDLYASRRTLWTAA